MNSDISDKNTDKRLKTNKSGRKYFVIQSESYFIRIWPKYFFENLRLRVETSTDNDFFNPLTRNS